MLILQLVLLFSETLRVCLAEPEDLYCGDKNCYDGKKRLACMTSAAGSPLRFAGTLR